MREILFRGKRVDNGEWVQGCLHLEYEGVRDTLEEAIIIGKYAKTYNNAIHGCLKVNPSTISEFTGLKDMNGKKIFEGDIVSTYDGNFEVYYHDGWQPQMKRKLSNGYTKYEPLDFYEMEVIGNIYDNPELMEGQI